MLSAYAKYSYPSHSFSSCRYQLETLIPAKTTLISPLFILRIKSTAYSFYLATPLS